MFVSGILCICLYCDACSCRCSCMGNLSVPSCKCCMFVSCVHIVAVGNVAFSITCSLLLLVDDARGDHMEETYSRTGLMSCIAVTLAPSHSLSIHIFNTYNSTHITVTATTTSTSGASTTSQTDQKQQHHYRHNTRTQTQH